MTTIQEHKIYPLAIEGYASDGDGVARLDGVVVFVKGAVRGETCQVYIDKVGKRAVWGHVCQLLSPAPARVPMDCPYNEDCGGCQLRHMSYEEELVFKRQKVEDALRRIGGADVAVSVIHGAPSPLRYRNKVQFPVGPGPVIGFYQKRSHAVTDVADCLLQPPSAARLRSAVKDWMETYAVPHYDEGTGAGLVRHVYLRFNRAGESLLCLLVNGPSIPDETALVATLRAADPHLVGIVLGINESRSNVILGEEYRTLWGQDFLIDRLCGLDFKLSVPSFYQVNPDQAEVLYGRAIEFAALTGKETVLDLYCGIGTITLAMSRTAGTVIGCEVVPEAVADAKENAARNSIKNAEFLLADAGQAARALADRGLCPDVVCVDPPRKGLTDEVIDSIARMNPQRVVYVSCDCATLARDVKKFSQHGYTLQTAEAADLFPRTQHVETVVLLSKCELYSEKTKVKFSLKDM